MVEPIGLAFFFCEHGAILKPSDHETISTCPPSLSPCAFPIYLKNRFLQLSQWYLTCPWKAQPLTPSIILKLHLPLNTHPSQSLTTCTVLDNLLKLLFHASNIEVMQGELFLQKHFSLLYCPSSLEWCIISTVLDWNRLFIHFIYHRVEAQCTTSYKSMSCRNKTSYFLFKCHSRC